ncbi:MAG: hypothetical protein ACJAZ1_001894 [Yoonia sp.]|jgi:hypothetical protein
MLGAEIARFTAPIVFQAVFVVVASITAVNFCLAARDGT